MKTGFKMQSVLINDNRFLIFIQLFFVDFIKSLLTESRRYQTDTPGIFFISAYAALLIYRLRLQLTA